MDAEPTGGRDAKAIFYMDEELRPHRSMTPRGLMVVLAILFAFNLLIAVFLFVIGAYPAPIFLGLDFVGVLIAFRVSNKRALSGERVLVTHDEVRVLRGAGGRAVLLWASPTVFTKLEVDRADGLVTHVRLRLRQRVFALARALGPTERADFATKLQAAMRSALAERHV